MFVHKRLLAHADVPATGKRPQHEATGARFAEMKGDGMRINDLDVMHRRKQRLAWHADALGWPDDAGEGGLHVLSGEVGAVMEFDTLAQVKGVDFAVRRNVPLLGQIGEYRYPVAGITANEVVIHRALRPHVGHRSRLMNIEVGWGAVDRIAE